MKAAIAKVNTSQISKVEDCFSLEYPSLKSLLQTTETTAQVTAYLSEVLIDINEFLNVSERMTPRQVKITIELILSEFGSLNVADIKLCSKMIMAGKFGQIYNRIDGQLILGWFRTYLDQRLETAETISQNEHQRLKNEEKKPFDPKVAQAMKKVLEGKGVNFEGEISDREPPEGMDEYRGRYGSAKLEYDQLPESEKTEARRKEIFKKWDV